MSDKIIKHPGQIAYDVVVPVPDNRDALLGKPAGATFVGWFLLSSMLAAIEFDGEAQAGAVEVERERPNRMLSSEMEAIELIASKHAPKLAFGVRHAASQVSCPRSHALGTRET